MAVQHVREDPADEARSHEDDRVDERRDRYRPCGLVLGEIHPVHEAHEPVGGEGEGGEGDEEPAPPGQGVVGAGDRAAPEGPGHVDEAEGRWAHGQRIVRQDEGEADHEEDRRDHRDRRDDEQDHALVAHGVGQEGGDEDRKVLGDGDPRGDAGALELGDLIGQDRDEGDRGGVGADLAAEPAERR